MRFVLTLATAIVLTTGSTADDVRILKADADALGAAVLRFSVNQTVTITGARILRSE